MGFWTANKTWASDIEDGVENMFVLLCGLAT